MKEDILGVAMVKHLCPVCTSEEESIAMNQNLNPTSAAKVKALDGQPVGWLSQPCVSCQERANEFEIKGIHLVGMDPVKSEGAERMSQIYRTGDVITIDGKLFFEMFKGDDNSAQFARQWGFVFTEQSALDKMKKMNNGMD